MPGPTWCAWRARSPTARASARSTSPATSPITPPFLLARILVPLMRRRGSGHVATIGSVADHVAFPGSSAYAATKFGVRGLHGVIAAELVASGVRTTLVSPGPVDTEMWDPIDPDSKPPFTKRK